MKILHVVGARPNFMKTAPLFAAMSREPQVFEQFLVHTGQHYDFAMSGVFFSDLGLPAPDECLGVGGGSHAEQTAAVMVSFDRCLTKYCPDIVILVGDVNSTLGCALVCAKSGVRFAHVEAGLRSGDRTMPEEINRLVTDQLADWLFTPSPEAETNLLKEGVHPDKIHFVGNIMIDALVRQLPSARASDIGERLGVTGRPYALVTLHRPFNVDFDDSLSQILDALTTLGKRMPVVFPIHPRTRKRLEQMKRLPVADNVILSEPLGYRDFLSLMSRARLVITDSGGVQEETCWLGIQCLTIRPSTERPVTIECGTNRLVGCTRDEIVAASESALADSARTLTCPAKWDGKTADRIVEILKTAV